MSAFANIRARTRHDGRLAAFVLVLSLSGVVHAQGVSTNPGRGIGLLSPPGQTIRPQANSRQLLDDLDRKCSGPDEFMDKILQGIRDSIRDALVNAATARPLKTDPPFLTFTPEPDKRTQKLSWDYRDYIVDLIHEVFPLTQIGDPVGMVLKQVDVKVGPFGGEYVLTISSTRLGAVSTGWFPIIAGKQIVTVSNPHFDFSALTSTYDVNLSANPLPNDGDTTKIVGTNITISYQIGLEYSLKATIDGVDHECPEPVQVLPANFDLSPPKADTNGDVTVTPVTFHDQQPNILVQATASAIDSEFSNGAVVYRHEDDCGPQSVCSAAVRSQNLVPGIGGGAEIVTSLPGGTPGHLAAMSLDGQASFSSNNMPQDAIARFDSSGSIKIFASVPLGTTLGVRVSGSTKQSGDPSSTIDISSQRQTQFYAFDNTSFDTCYTLTTTTPSAYDAQGRLYSFLDEFVASGSATVTGVTGNSQNENFTGVLNVSVQNGCP